MNTENKNEIENIKKYVEIAKNGMLISIDVPNKEFIYQYNGSVIKGFFENVEVWIDSLFIIENEKYMLTTWWKEKNNIEFNLLAEGQSIKIKGETEKAYYLTNNAGSNIWIPKSQLIKVEV